MKTFKELLIELDPCEIALIWAEDKKIEEIVKNCHRGDWLLWLSKKIDLPLMELTLAKGRCAETVKHLMKDERSKKAVEVAISFGLGNATRDELNSAAADAADYAAPDYAAATADYADYAYAAYAAAAYAAAATAAAADAKTKNQLQTAEICRDILGQLIINKVNELLK